MALLCPEDRSSGASRFRNDYLAKECLFELGVGASGKGSFASLRMTGLLCVTHFRQLRPEVEHSFLPTVLAVELRSTQTGEGGCLHMVLLCPEDRSSGASRFPNDYLARECLFELGVGASGKGSFAPLRM